MSRSFDLRSMAGLVVAFVFVTAGSPARAVSPDEVFVPEILAEKPSGKGGYALSPTLEVGGPDADEPAQFYEKFGGIVADADAAGRIYVLDDGNHRVQVFAADGSHVLSAGSEGEGPGEFKLPSRLTVNAKGEFAIFDMVQQRISVFDPEGALRRDRIVDGSLADMVLTDDGGLVCAYQEPVPALVEKLDAAGKPVWRYGIRVEPESREMNEIVRKINIGTVAPRLASGGSIFYHASPETYCVRRVAPNGDLLAGFARPIERKAFEMPKRKDGSGPRMVMVRREETVDASGGGGTKTDVSVGSHPEGSWDMKAFMPEFQPDIRGVLAWPNGRVWILTSTGDDDSMVVDEWNAKAEYLRRFEIPTDYAKLRVGRDGNLYGVGHDEDDFPIVYRLEVEEIQSK